MRGPGWRCNLREGHVGPCPAWPTLRTALTSQMARHGHRNDLLAMWLWGRRTRRNTQ